MLFRQGFQLCYFDNKINKQVSKDVPSLAKVHAEIFFKSQVVDKTMEICI